MSVTHDPAFAVTLEELAAVPRIVTVGTFDGVHRGHRYLLASAVARGQSRAIETVGLTFEPPPAAVLRPDRFPGRICAVNEKFAQLRDCGIQRIITLEFNLDLARQTPEQFMTRLATATMLQELWVGEGFALGKDRAGTIPRLTEIGSDLGFTVVAVPRLSVGDEIVSSSAIRAAVIAGDVSKARRLLGRPFRVSGEVVHGAHVGRQIGFPTANVEPPPNLVPLADGIYASHALLPGDTIPRPAMTYVGTRPTINAGPRLVETNLLDFDADLYGLHLCVDLIERLRPDATFPSLDALVAQLRQDERDARAVLFRHNRDHEQSSDTYPS